MDNYLRQSIMNRLEATAKALRKNRMEAHIVNDRLELLEAIRALVPKGESICSGGSMTLNEAGVIDLFTSEGYDYYFRGRVDPVTGAPMDVYLKAFSADWYFTSSNAITLNGELYNVDGNANRIAAMSYGPKNVVVVAGYNKIVADLAEAEERVKSIAAPANCIRLDKQNGCHITGHCVNCHSDSRICCTTAIHGFQRTENRIKVFLLPEVLGY